MAAFWQITYGDVTQDAATWGVSHVTRKRKSAATSVVTFKLDGALFDTNPLPFRWRQPLAILRDGLPWFSGIVTKPMPKASGGKGESIDYEISSPWYYLEKTVFQQQWVTTDVEGGALVTMTTTRSSAILGQSLDGVKMNSGQVMLEALLYAQYAFQMQPFPTTVNINHLPPAPDPTKGPLPFLIGTITPTITVPYSQVKNKSCADIIRLMMKYSPDAVAWEDFSTSPPTINIGQRGTLTGKTISVIDFDPTDFSPTPRYDLQVPVVVAKFEEKNSVDGTTTDYLDVQVWPPAPVGVDPDAWASQTFAWVQTIDLIGGHTTSQKAPFTVRARPTSLADPLLPGWFLRKEPWLTQQVAGINLYDTANIQFAFFGPGNYIPATNTYQYIDPDDPLTATHPTPQPVLDGFNLDCHTLVAEIITGKMADWLYATDGILAAKILIEVWAEYVGTDPNTAALFTFNPANPSVPTAPGGGYFVRWYGLTATNAETETYSELTSWAASEPVPVGFAQQLQEALAELHFDGTLTIMEDDECSDPLPPGCIFNTTDGNPDWQAMNALVLSVEEDIDNRTTKVQFGPPLILGLGELEELFRANLGILPSYKLEQRQTGVVTAGANVDDGKHMAHSTASGPPTAPAKPLPWAVSIVKIGGVWVAQVNPGKLMKSKVEGDSVVVDNCAPTTLDITQTANSTDFIYLECAVASLEPSGDASVNSGSAGGTYDPTKPAWDAGGKGYLADNGGSPPSQTFFRVQLAKIATGPAVGGVTPAPVATPCCTTNLIIENTFEGTEPGIEANPASTAS